MEIMVQEEKSQNTRKSQFSVLLNKIWSWKINERYFETLFFVFLKPVNLFL